MTVAELIKYLEQVTDKDMKIGITTYMVHTPCMDLSKPYIGSDPDDRTYKPDNILVIYAHM